MCCFRAFWGRVFLNFFGFSGTPEQLGAASKSLAKSLKHLASLSKAGACLAGDSVSQQAMLTAARAVSIAGQQLVLSARQAQKTGDDLAQTSLGGSAQSVSDAVKELISFAQTASADASKGMDVLASLFVSTTCFAIRYEFCYTLRVLL